MQRSRPRRARRAPPDVPIAIWHGLNGPAGDERGGLAGGLALYFALQRDYELHLHAPRAGPARLVYTHAIDAHVRAGAARDGRARKRLAAALPGLDAGRGGGRRRAARSAASGAGHRRAPAADRAAAGAGRVARCSRCGVALLQLHRERLVAVVLVGAVGLVVSTAFIALSAPDLALTQLSVDVVSTVMLLMGLALLPQPLAARVARRHAGGATPRWPARRAPGMRRRVRG